MQNEESGQTRSADPPSLKLRRTGSAALPLIFRFRVVGGSSVVQIGVESASGFGGEVCVLCPEGLDGFGRYGGGGLEFF